MLQFGKNFVTKKGTTLERKLLQTTARNIKKQKSNPEIAENGEANGQDQELALMGHLFLAKT